MEWFFPVLGFMIGLLVGFTGIGGAAFMTPLLILIGGMRPVIAVGTDLVYGAITKVVGAFLHYKQRTVDIAIALHLGIGSIPAAFLGVFLISWIRKGNENGDLDQFISRMLGIVLILVALSLLFRPSRPQPSTDNTLPLEYSKRQMWLTTIIGAVIGFVVGLTSIGSGSLVAASLVILYPGLPLRRIVGTDIFHAAFLTTAAGLAHLSIGTVDLPAVGGLLLGSIPGVWLGSRLAVRVPDKVLRLVLASAMMGIGYKLL